jgi:hypothetical protein
MLVKQSDDMSEKIVTEHAILWYYWCRGA